jgi:hypothetical protein
MLQTVLCALLAQQMAAVGAPDETVPLGSEQAVLAAYRRMEEADRKGDVQLWLALRDRKTVAGMSTTVKDSIQSGAHARPKVRYEPGPVRVAGERAILMGKAIDEAAGTTQYQTVLFSVEDGVWKVSREQWSDTAFDPFTLYGLLPGEGGAFTRAGSPWKRVPYAAINTQVIGKKEAMWKMQAVYDDAFLYIRFEWISEIPAPGAKVKADLAATGKTGGPPPPAAMRVKGDDLRSLTFAVNDLLSTRGNQSTVSYSLFVRNDAGEDVFQYPIGSDPLAKLLSVQDRFVDIRVPLGGVGIDAAGKSRVQLEDTGSVLRVLPYTVERYFGR